MSLDTPASSALEEFYDALRSRGPTLNLLFEQARIAPDREGDTIVRDAFSGAILTVLYDTLRTYCAKQGAKKNDWRRIWPTINGCSVPQIVAAAVDNFKHFEQWDAEKPISLIQRRSVKVLCAVLDIQPKKSKRQPFRGNVCWAVLEKLSGGAGYTRIDALMREVARAFDSRAEA